MTYTEALPYVATLLDDALAVKPFDPANIPEGALLVGWQCGFEPMFIAVHSYLPNVTLDSEEAEEITTDYLEEKGWFKGSGRDHGPDYIIRAPKHTTPAPQPEQEQQETAAPAEAFYAINRHTKQATLLTGFSFWEQVQGAFRCGIQISPGVDATGIGRCLSPDDFSSRCKMSGFTMLA